jgi:transposase-like protein
MPQAELSHLAQQHNTPEPARNHCNGSSKKSVLAAETNLTLDIPHDRDSSSSPSTSGACRALATRSFRSIRAACQYLKSGGALDSQQLSTLLRV